MADRDAQIIQFCRLIRARTKENREAVNLLLENRLYSVAFGILRQEIDSLIRVSYLNNISIGNSPARARALVRDLVEGDRWQRTTVKGKLVNVTDREMLIAYQRAVGWEKLVYEFGCQLIHLSRFHDYRDSDPIATMEEEDKLEIVGYLRQYHSFQEVSLTFEALVEYLPKIINKICDNTNCITDSFERRIRNQLA